MPQKSTAAVIAVGSEIVSGQIINRNAAWISSRLYELGIDTSFHLSVDDIESEIIGALQLAVGRAGLIFMTGGLGPTSDDLTRQAVAKFAGQPLVFDPESWTHIERHFARFSNTVPETNRQQCYFPLSAQVLVNNAGTANAFRIAAHGAEIWVLPGPPREVDALWKDHVAGELSQLIPATSRKILRMWRTIGLGESHLAEKIEPLVQGQGVDVAYRVHAPYVETKIRFASSAEALHKSLLQTIDDVLDPYIFERDKEDVPSTLIKVCMKHQSFSIYDGASKGNLIELLAPSMRELAPKVSQISLASSWENHEHPEQFLSEYFALQSDSELALAVAGYNDSGEWAVGLKRFDEVTITARSSLYQGEVVRDTRAVSALAAKAWLDLLTGALS